ncbi:MAG: L,D-transpeptidase family protein [Spirosomataceae bacterium]
MRAIVSRFLFLSVIMGFYSCRKTSDMTNGELMTHLHKKGIYKKLEKYGQSVGVSSAASTPPDTTFALLEEISYGHQPTHIRFTQKVKPIDSMRIRQAAIDLADGKSIEKTMENLEPSFPAYRQLKDHFKRFYQHNEPDSAAIVAESLNAYRWIYRQTQGAQRMVLVNTRGAYLKGLEANGEETLRMNVIVGKQSSPTPGIDTYATNIILYPYWNIPKKIALKEMLPKIKEDNDYLDNNGIAVLDNEGQVVESDQIDWDEVSEDKFPYRFRQDNGEDNSLGLLKVNIKNPLAIYLHDTNVRNLFESSQRWRSHGCVRLQNPAALANFLAGKHLINEDFTHQPVTDQTPQSTPLKENIPVFILYLGADVNEAGQLIFFKDIYAWGNKVS